MFPSDIDRLARSVVSTAAARGLKVTCAESCTGGLVSGAITAVPGSSGVFDFGFVTYSNAAKSRMLGAPPELIDAHGAVSAEVARAMAEGARLAAGADAAVSVTGIAGPGGGSPAKPIGLVHFAVAGPTGVVHIERRFGDMGRDAVRLESVRTALSLLLEQIAE